MSWRSLRWWLAGAVVYLVFLLATLPASYITGWLRHRVPEVQLAGVQGSVWTGNAVELAVAGNSWGRIRWCFDWAGLVSGHPGYRLHLEGTGLDLHARVAGNTHHLLLRDVEGHLDLQRLDPWLPLPPDAIRGDLQLDLHRVELASAHPIAADGVVSLANTTVSWPQVLTLGSYQLKLMTRAGSGISGTLLDRSGPLALQGSLQLEPDGHYAISGTLASRDRADVALNKLLDFMPVNASGDHQFSFSGQWQ
ncbi:MAG: type II secretion system protein N [Gammaproteobacteria bacterium]